MIITAGLTIVLHVNLLRGLIELRILAYHFHINRYKGPLSFVILSSANVITRTRALRTKEGHCEVIMNIASYIILILILF